MDPCVRGSPPRAATATCDYYITWTPGDGIPYWDTGAPSLSLLGDDFLSRPADPHNSWEPIDSSAAAIACQALLRLGHWLRTRESPDASRYFKGGLTILHRLLGEPYLAVDPSHEGLLLHGLYHRPRGWDHVRAAYVQPADEAVLWGDYHLVEAALYVERLGRNRPYYAFFGP